MALPLQNTALLKKLHITLFLLVATITNIAQAQSLLLPGDITFISVNSTTDSFEFIPLIDLEKGTEFKISNGLWDDKKQEFVDGNVVHFSVRERVVAGTPILYQKGKEMEFFNMEGTMSLSEEEEQLLVFQVDEQTNRFIYAIGWGEKQKRRDRSLFGSDIPQVLAENPEAVLRLGTYNNYQYFIRNGASGTVKMLQNFIADAAHWRGQDEVSFKPVRTSFHILNAPVVLFDESTSSIKEGKKNTSLKVAIYEHDGSKLTVDVVFDSMYSSIDRSEIQGFRNQQINFTGLIGDAVYEIEIPLNNDEDYEGIETGIFTLKNLSKGKYGDFISHTLLLDDDEIPELKLETVKDMDQNILLIHNLERTAIDLFNWELRGGNAKIDFPKGTYLEVGETLFILPKHYEESVFLSGSLFELAESDAKLLDVEGKIELRDRNGQRIEETEIKKRDDNKREILASTTNKETGTGEVSTESLFSGEKMQLPAAPSDILPGWKSISSNEINSEEFANVDLYYWSESNAVFFKLGDEALTAPKNSILVGFFDEVAASELQKKKKPIANSEKEGILEIQISATDVDENGSIQGIEGLNLVKNNTGISFLAAELKTNLIKELGLKTHPVILRSSFNYGKITMLDDADVLIPGSTFWIKIDEIVSPKEIALNTAFFEEIIPDVEETEKGLLSFEVKGENGVSTFNVSFLSEENLQRNLLDLTAYQEVYLSEPSDLISFSAEASGNRYHEFGISEVSENVIRLPINFIALQGGEFELHISEWNNVPDGWMIKLVDEREGKSYELTDKNWSLKFDYYPKKNPGESDNIRLPEFENRFILRIIPESQVVNEITEDIPESIELHQNYPNPFNPATTISFYLPESSEVKLSVFNIVGQPVAVLLQDTKAQGEHSVEWDASDMPSGMYIYQLEVGTKIMTRKMTLVK